MSGKFRDKETGAEGYLRANREIEYQIEDEKGVPINGSFKTLSELLEKWEEIEEEPKKYWFIDAYGNIVQNEITKHYGDEYTDMTDAYESQKQIGNYFGTEEEAEKVVEKLKAITRLEDKGFRFDGYDVAHNGNGDLCGQIFYNAGNYCIEDVEKDLDLLFGGEE